MQWFITCIIIVGIMHVDFKNCCMFKGMVYTLLCESNCDGNGFMDLESI